MTAQTGSAAVAVAGHSLGGTLATILAARRPDRVAALAVLEASPIPPRWARTCACSGGRPMSSRCPARCSATSSTSSTATTRSPGGALEITGERVGSARLTAPLTVVVDPRSAVIPPASVVPVYEAAASADKLLLRYGGDVGVALQHVGVIVGSSAHRDLWPRILDRLGATE